MLFYACSSPVTHSKTFGINKQCWVQIKLPAFLKQNSFDFEYTWMTHLFPTGPLKVSDQVGEIFHFVVRWGCCILPPEGSQRSHAPASPESQPSQSWHNRRNQWEIWWRCDESPAPWNPETHRGNTAFGSGHALVTLQQLSIWGLVHLLCLSLSPLSDAKQKKQCSETHYFTMNY